MFHKNMDTRYLQNNVRVKEAQLATLPALIKEFNREADDLIICDYSLVFICHLSSILIWPIRSYRKMQWQDFYYFKTTEADTVSIN